MKNKIIIQQLVDTTFHQFDKDNKGFLTKLEIIELIQLSLSHNIVNNEKKLKSSEISDEVLNNLNIGNINKISKDEFKSLIQPYIEELLLEIEQ